MRRLPLAGAVILFALAAGGEAQGADDPATAYRETVRCYNAAANYAQQFVISGEIGAQTAMMGYSAELRGRAYAAGARLGKSKAAVRNDFRDNDSTYLHQFYAFANGTMTVTDFGSGEITHCKLDKVAQP
jgi:hypothetical protein